MRIKHCHSEERSDEESFDYTLLGEIKRLRFVQDNRECEVQIRAVRLPSLVREGGASQSEDG